MTPSSKTGTLEDRFRVALDNLVGGHEGVLLAVSGGSDSLGLACLGAALALREGRVFKIGFVDHGLRREAQQELDFVRAHARRLGLDLLWRKIDEVPDGSRPPGGSLQQWARERRYELLAEMATEAGLQVIATAHTLDDQAETVLMRVLRGAGLDGLRGIPVVRKLDAGGARVVRPLLEMSRGEVRGYLTDQGIDWVEDPSNRNPRFVRTRVRDELLPLMESIQPGVAGRLVALANDAGGLLRAFDRHLETLPSAVETLNLPGGFRVAARTFEESDEGLWGLIIRRAIACARGNLRRIERGHIEPIAQAVAQAKSTREFPLPGSAYLFVDQGSLYVFSEEPSSDPVAPTPLVLAADSLGAKSQELGAQVSVTGDVEGFGDSLVLRARNEGDRLLESEKKLKDLLIAEGIPRPYRAYVPLLASGSEIISSPVFPDRDRSGLTISWNVADSAPIRDIIE